MTHHLLWFNVHGYYITTSQNKNARLSQVFIWSLAACELSQSAVTAWLVSFIVVAILILTFGRLMLSGADQNIAALTRYSDDTK